CKGNAASSAARAGAAPYRPAAAARRGAGRRRRQRNWWTTDQLLALAAWRKARGDLRGRERGRDVPALAVLPAVALVDQAVCAVRARLARVRPLRPEQPPAGA